MESSNLINDVENKYTYDSIILTIPQYTNYKFQKILNGIHTFLLLILVSIATLWIQTGASLYIPMYSEVAMKKGLSDSEIGVIMGMSPFQLHNLPLHECIRQQQQLQTLIRN